MTNSSTLRWPQVARHAPVLLFCAAYVGLRIVAGQMGSLVLILIAVPVMLWIVFNVAFITTRPAERRVRLINLTLCALTFSAFAVVKDVQLALGREEARRQADAVVAQVQAYRARTGAWPRSLGSADINEPAVAELHMEISRWNTEGRTELVYVDQLDDDNPFGMSFYVYDLDRKVWKHVRD